jgi:hypothetical protein
MQMCNRPSSKETHAMVLITLIRVMDNQPKGMTSSQLPPLHFDPPAVHNKKRLNHPSIRLAIALCILYACLRHSIRFIHYWNGTSDLTSEVYWKSCGEGYGDELQCANVSVPLDYRNESDGRTISIAVTRLLASDKQNRCVLVGQLL